MSNFQEPADYIEKIFQINLVNSSIPNFIKIKLLHSNVLKKTHEVVKTNKYLKYLNDIDFIIIINENYLLDLTDEQVSIILDEALCYVGYDQEKDKIFKVNPNVITFDSIIKKYSFEKLEEISIIVEATKERLKEE